MASDPVVLCVHHWGHQGSSFLLPEGKRQVSHQLLPWELGEASVEHRGKWRMDVRCLERFLDPSSGSLHCRLTILHKLGLSGSSLPASLTSHGATSPLRFLRSCLTHPSCLPGTSCSGSKRQKGGLSLLSLPVCGVMAPGILSKTQIK